MCYLCSERCSCRGGVGDNWFVVIFDLNSSSCMGVCLFIRAIADKMALLSIFEASACLAVLLVFFVICGFTNNGRSIHRVIVLGRKTWLRRLCAISLSAPVLVVGSRVVASRAAPDPSRSLSLSLSLGMVTAGSAVFQVECFSFQVDFLLTLNCSSLLFVAFRIFHPDTSVGQQSRKS